MIRRSSAYLLAAAGVAAALGAGEPSSAPLAVGRGESRTKAEERVRFGDAWLRGALDFAARRRSEGHYEAPAGDGRTAILTLDPELQARAEEVLAASQAKRAGIVVMALDGRILALAGDALEPWAPAASVFKVVTAAALLDAGLEPESRVCFHGGVRSIDAENLVDDARKDDACGTLATAVARSQNAVIAKLAARHLEAAALADAARDFGFNAAPDFALPAGASTARIPEDDPLELARAAAGFWHTTLSPLGGALLADVVATGGRRVTPRIVAAVRDERGQERAILPAAPVVALDPDTASALAEMMLGTTEHGTAWRGFFDAGGKRILGDVTVAGKTGSLTGRDGDRLHYSWFVGFAPADAPEYVISVLLGNGRAWRYKAHTAARMVLEAAFRR